MIAARRCPVRASCYHTSRLQSIQPRASAENSNARRAMDLVHWQYHFPNGEHDQHVDELPDDQHSISPMSVRPRQHFVEAEVAVQAVWQLVWEVLLLVGVARSRVLNRLDRGAQEYYSETPMVQDRFPKTRSWVLAVAQVVLVLVLVRVHFLLEDQHHAVL